MTAAADNVRASLANTKATMAQAVAALADLDAKVALLLAEVEGVPPVVTPPAPVLTDVDQDQAVYAGTWQVGSYPGAFHGSDAYTGQAGAKATLTFTGTEFVIWGTKDVHHGTAALSVDGIPMGTLSYQAPQRAESVAIIHVPGLTTRQHVVTITANGDGVISLDRFTTDGTVKPPPIVVTPPPTPPGPVTPPPTGSLKQLTVGRNAKGYMTTLDNGVYWLGRGTNQYLFSYASTGDMTPLSNWISADPSVLANWWAAAGVNYVCIPVNNDRSASYVAKLRAFVNALAAKGIRSSLRPFGGVVWAPSDDTGALAGDLWNLIGKPAHVMLATVNEPNRISNQQWLDGNIACVRAMRSRGYTGPVMVDCQSWAWTIPIAEAKALVAAVGDQLVFMSHRYCFDGSTIRQASDANLWYAEWKGAADAGLAVGVEEWGFFNGGGTFAQSQPWLISMSAMHLRGISEGWLSTDQAWMELWDLNSHISGVRGGGWWEITQGEPFQRNAWGQIVASEWAKAGQLVPA